MDAIMEREHNFRALQSEVEDALIDYSKDPLKGRSIFTKGILVDKTIGEAKGGDRPRDREPNYGKK